MTPKQLEYARHRAAGLGQTRAAVAAGYAKGSAKVIASRMEKLPEIRTAIDGARRAAKGSSPDAPEPEFTGAEDYLLSVVQGKAPPDPVRVGAARALLPFEKRRQRAPLPAVRTPRQQAHADDLSATGDLNERFRARVAALKEKK